MNTHDDYPPERTCRYLVTISDVGNITDRAENVHTILTSRDNIQPRERVAVENFNDVAIWRSIVDDAASFGAEAWEHAGRHFTCDEIEALADVFRAAGLADYAAQMIGAHALADNEPTDRHHAQYLAAQDPDWPGL